MGMNMEPYSTYESEIKTGNTENIEAAKESIVESETSAAESLGDK